MELFEVIRRGYAAGETIQGLSKKHGVHRRMVRQAIGILSRSGVLSVAPKQFFGLPSCDKFLFGCDEPALLVISRLPRRRRPAGLSSA